MRPAPPHSHNLGLDATYHQWRAKVGEKTSANQRFDAWLFLNASSVLLSEKTGELLTVDLKELNLPIGVFQGALSRLAVEWVFDFRVMHQSKGRIKFVVYQKDRLEKALREAPKCILHGKLGYAKENSGESFLTEVAARWTASDSLPHEIGLALGYPALDVFGFMGLLPLPCKGVCGWRVYGCFDESKRRSDAFTNARCRALAFLAERSSMDDESQHLSNILSDPN